jgi:uncharacterized membrane protein
MRFISMALLGIALTMPAHAALNICNKARHPAKVALGRFDGRAWKSEGWWTIQPGKCAELIKMPLEARYYYIYGTDTDSGVWDGGTSFCTATNEKFSISGQGDCARRGYDRRRFFQIDTGNNTDHTQTLQ